MTWARPKGTRKSLSCPAELESHSQLLGKPVPELYNLSLQAGAQMTECSSKIKLGILRKWLGYKLSPNILSFFLFVKKRLDFYQ